MRKYIMIALAAGLFTACGLYAPYSRPQMETDHLYPEAPVGADTSSIASLRWEELFTDPQLQALIRQGLRSNTDLRVALLQVEEAKAVLLNARLAYLPALSLSPEGTISHTEQRRSTLHLYNIAASASWEVDLFGRLTSAKRGAKEALEGSRDYAQAVRTQLIATIANSYYTLLMLDSQLRIGGQTLLSWERSIQTLEALKRSGQVNEAAISQAKANRLQLESSLLAVRKSIQETEYSLAAL
ncbi:MAG: TolC family protein, partial [Parabacteroides sp.]